MIEPVGLIRASIAKWFEDCPAMFGNGFCGAVMYSLNYRDVVAPRQVSAKRLPHGHDLLVRCWDLCHWT